ncbi:hypothetical protein MGH68_03585 [Erysipelothrix sp. D19-032]
MELALPQHYTMLDELETNDPNGGSWERAALYGAVIAGSIALGAALVYGQYWLAARMLGHSVRYVVRKHGINSVMRVIALPQVVFQWGSRGSFSTTSLK